MDFHSLPRRELQALCKKNRIPANMTNVAMADALRALKSVEGIDEQQAATAAAAAAAAAPQFESPLKPDARISSRKLSAASVEPKEQQASPLPRARRVTFKSSDITSLVAEGGGDNIEEKDLGAEQVVPPAPAAPIVQEMASRITRRASKKEEAKEEGGDDAVEAMSNRTPVTRNGGRRTTARRALATSAPVEEVEEQMVAPSRIEEKDLGTEQVVPPAPAAPIMQEMASRTKRRTASKKEEAKEEGGDDAVDAMSNKTPVTRNGGRRTTTRRAVATSAPVEEVEEQMVAPSRIEEKDLGAEKVVPPVPAAPIMQEMTSRTTRRRASKKEEAKEEGGEDAVEATTNKTPVTRNGGRRTTTRRAVATSASVEEGEEEQMLAPSRTTRSTRQASKTPAGDSVAASALLRRSTRAKGTVSKMSPLAPEEASQKEKVVETMDLLDSETRLQELDVVQEKNNSDTEICPSVTANVNQILGEVKDDKLMKEASEQQNEVVEAMDLLDSEMKLQELDVVQEKNHTCPSITANVYQILGEVEDDKLIEEVSEQQDKGVEINEFQNEGDDALALPDNKSSEEVLEENVGETGEICSQDFDEKGELVAEVETICQGEEKSNQADSSLSGLDGSPVVGHFSSIEDIVINGEVAEKQSVHDEDTSLLQETKDADGDLIVGQEVEGENLSLEKVVINEDVADNKSSEDVLEENEGETGQECVEQGKQVAEVETTCQGEEKNDQAHSSLSEIEESTSEDMVINREVVDKQSVHDEDKSFLINEVGQEVEGEYLSLENFVINEAVAGNQGMQYEDESLEPGETKDAGSGPLVAEEAESGNACLEVESEDLSSILVEGSGESPSSQDTDPSADDESAEVEELIGGKNPTDFEFMHDSVITTDDAVSSALQKVPSSAFNLQSLTESTGEMLALKVDMIKECAEPPPSEKLDEEIDNICANYSSKIQESDANKENMTGILVGVEDDKVKVDSESDKQNIDLKNCSLRKLKSLLREKINDNNQKIERKRSALAQINENCLQRAS